MNIVEIKDYLAVQDLEKFVEKLPKERRAEAYIFIHRFYTIGAGDGALVGLVGETAEDMPKKYKAYFSRKIDEQKI